MGLEKNIAIGVMFLKCQDKWSSEPLTQEVLPHH